MIGLPSLRALDRTEGTRIWLAAEPTDMRCGCDRLAEQVRSVIGQDPLGDSLFIFRSRRGDRLKLLMWDRDGFILWYKRLEAGVFKLPRVKDGARSVELRASELWGRRELYSVFQADTFFLASKRFQNQLVFKHSSRSFPLKLSMPPFCVGLPGWMCTRSIFHSMANAR